MPDHAAYNSYAKIAGRIPEQQFIRNFIIEFINSSPVSQMAKPVLYISGSPGCGKTALVNTILAMTQNGLGCMGVLGRGTWIPG